MNVVEESFEDNAYSWIFGGWGLSGYDAFEGSNAEDLLTVDQVVETIIRVIDLDMGRTIQWQPPGQVVDYKFTVSELDGHFLRKLAEDWFLDHDGLAFDRSKGKIYSYGGSGDITAEYVELVDVCHWLHSGGGSLENAVITENERAIINEALKVFLRREGEK
jgi:hypothetical protein